MRERERERHDKLNKILLKKLLILYEPFGWNNKKEWWFSSHLHVGGVGWGGLCV
jgi:hypothetical protein